MRVLTGIKVMVINERVSIRDIAHGNMTGGFTCLEFGLRSFSDDLSVKFYFGPTAVKLFFECKLRPCLQLFFTGQQISGDKYFSVDILSER